MFSFSKILPYRIEHWVRAFGTNLLVVISSDLALEQALIRSIKTTGGITRGREFSESPRALWILSMPGCAEVNNAMMSFTGTILCSSDQHKENDVSRQKRESKDTMIFASILEERNPFVEE